jgi:hypothetical protein
MNTKLLAFTAGLALASSGAMAETTGVSSSILVGPECVKASVGGTTYAWPPSNSSMTTVFQSSADNNRAITVWVASDLLGPGSPFPSRMQCNEGDLGFAAAFVAG